MFLVISLSMILASELDLEDICSKTTSPGNSVTAALLLQRHSRSTAHWMDLLSAIVLRSESLDGQGHARPEQGSDWRPSLRCWLQVPGRLRPICSCRPWTSGAHLRTTMTLEHRCHRAGRRRKATCESTNALSLCGTQAPFHLCAPVA